MASLTSKEWRDLIFEGKNKEFGAYDLRKKSEKRHTLAVIFTFIGLVIVILGVIGYSKWADYRAQLEAERLLAEREKMMQLDLSETEEPEEEQEEQKYEEPPEEVPPVEEEVAQTKASQSVIQDNVETEMKNVQELKEDQNVITSQNKEGAQIDVDALKKDELKAVAPEPPKKEEPKPQPDKIFEAVEQQAEFPGGQAALMKWLSNNIRYPDNAQQNGVQGRVVVRFVVEKDGSVSNVSVVKGVDKDLDQEAIRVVKRMPKWQPGKNNGQPVRSYFTLPVSFKLQ